MARTHAAAYRLRESPEFVDFVPGSRSLQSCGCVVNGISAKTVQHVEYIIM